MLSKRLIFEILHCQVHKLCFILNLALKMMPGLHPEIIKINGLLEISLNTGKYFIFKLLSFFVFLHVSFTKFSIFQRFLNVAITHPP